jgi:predicted nucleic acid-binding protein
MSERTLLVDASVFITLSRIDSVELLACFRGDVVMPNAVTAEITSTPADECLNNGIQNGWIVEDTQYPAEELSQARNHLGRSGQQIDGDVALLTIALGEDNPILVTDDKPLRQTCKSLSIPVSGSIGVLIRAVECDAIEPDEAKSKLYAMDEVGARLSASLVKRAEKLIDDASD